VCLWQERKRETACGAPSLPEKKKKQRISSDHSTQKKKKKKKKNSLKYPALNRAHSKRAHARSSSFVRTPRETATLARALTLQLRAAL
jgi:hypothetical protein